MCKFTKFFSILVVLLNLIFVIEVGYFSWFLVENNSYFSTTDLLVSVFINFSILFFAAVAAIGVVQSNLYLLGTWIIYAIIELSRSAIVLYDSWTADNDDGKFGKIFTTFDVGVQALTIFTVSVLFEVIKLQKDSRRKISTIERSLELNRRAHDKLKPQPNK